MLTPTQIILNLQVMLVAMVLAIIPELEVAAVVPVVMVEMPLVVIQMIQKRDMVVKHCKFLLLDQVLPHPWEHLENLDKVGMLVEVVVLVLTKHFQMQEEELVVEEMIALEPLDGVEEEMVLLVGPPQFHETR
tara:strand:- start:243 stop:641 length:399 start_codon:yes stop_codon:yes gene_type:complete